MIPLLYDKLGTTKIGELVNCIECLVEEERNGIFEISLIYPTTDFIFNSLEEENIIVCDANDTLKAQKFRIYQTRKLMSNKIEVYARHISFDLAYDTVDSINITNQSCEYALNSIFRQSQFSTHYRGYSDIANAQDYKINKVNCIEAIAGEEGSIIDTFGTGAEILRDNTNIHVLNKRGHDNSVSIEYAKNLTGFELEEDTTDLVTRIVPYAIYTDSETNQEIEVRAGAVDSPLINNYSHPYISYIDYSDKFEEGETPTISKLQTLARNEYKVNNADKPKQNYKIEFIPLSRCVGYEGLEDKISLCDIVTIKDTRYNINTKAKVIRSVFNVLKNRYESMELGEPKTTLGDIIGGTDSGKGEQGPPGPQGPPGADGNIGDFPNSLPSTPVLSSKLYGFANIELSWTFENKVYYQYELYASKTKDFTPNVFDIIHQGQTSSFLFQAKPNETWYFRVCCVNSHGNRTNFSSQITVTTKKIDDLSNYVDNMAIDDALIGTLNLDRGWVGQLRGNWIDAKMLSVTDGNGKRTLDIDSFGNVSLMPTNFKILVDGREENIATQSQMEQTAKDINSTVSTQASEISQLKDQIKLKVEQTDVDSAINTVTDEVTKTNSKVATLEANLDGITQRVSSTESTTSTLTSKVNIVEEDVNKALQNTDNIWAKDYSVNATTALPIKEYDDTNNLTPKYWYEVEGFIDNTSTDNGAMAIFKGDGTNFTVQIIKEKGTTSNHVKFFLNNGVPSVGLYNHTSFYKVRVHIKRLPRMVSSTYELSTTKSKVSSIETNLSSITSRVGTVESKQTTTDGKVTSLETWKKAAEQQITETAITNTVKRSFYTKAETENQITSKGYVTQSQVQQTVDEFQIKFEQGGAENIVLNSNWEGGMSSWNYHYTPTVRFENGHLNPSYGKMIRIQGDFNHGIWQKIETIPGKVYTVSFYAESHSLVPTTTKIGIEEHHMVDIHGTPAFQRHTFTFTATLSEHTFVVYSGQDGADFYVGRAMVTEGDIVQGYRQNSSEIYSNSVKFDINGMEIDSTSANTKNRINNDGFSIIDKSTLDFLLKATSEGVIARGGKFVVEDEENGNTVLWGRDVVINNQRALVGTGDTVAEGLDPNKLYVNYKGDFKNGVDLQGSAYLNGLHLLAQKHYNGYKNGWLDLNNGLILQWGASNSEIQGGEYSEFDITFPVNFNSECWCVVANIDKIDSGNDGLEDLYTHSIRNKSVSGATFRIKNITENKWGSWVHMSWFAIGK